MATYGLQADVAQPVVVILVISGIHRTIVNHIPQQWPCHPRKKEVNERRIEKIKYDLQKSKCLVLALFRDGKNYP